MLRLYDLLEKIVRNSGARWGKTVEVTFLKDPSIKSSHEYPKYNYYWTAPSDGILQCEAIITNDHMMVDMKDETVKLTYFQYSNPTGEAIPVHKGQTLRIWDMTTPPAEIYKFYFTPFA